MSRQTDAIAFVSRSRWLRWLAYVVGALALLVALAWIVVPPVVRAQLESRLTKTLQRPTTIERVAFDPLRLRLTIRNGAVGEPQSSSPLFAFDELVADLSAASLWHWAPVLDTLKIVRPSLRLARDRDNRYNIQDLIDLALAGPPGPPPRFSLNNIEIEDGSVTFDDGLAGRKHALAALDVAVPFISSLP
jgi:uncharacterized protein involved in outer membrane biogenesis